MRVRQLEEELENKSWLISDAKAEEIMSQNKDSFWKDVVTKMGKEFEILTDFPEDPQLN